MVSAHRKPDPQFQRELTRTQWNAVLSGGVSPDINTGVPEMDIKSIVKILAAVVVVLALMPFLLNLLPERVTADGVRAGLVKAGYTVTSYDVSPSPSLEAVFEARIALEPPGGGGMLHATLYEFDHEGKIRKQYEYNKDDPAQGIALDFAQATGLGGAQRPRPMDAGRNGMLLLVVSGDSQEAVRKAIRVFESL